jgi:hypothetical protein
VTAQELRLVLEQALPWWAQGQVSLWLVIAIAAIAAGGAYLGSYLQEKGRNLATREDLDRIVNQVQQLTRATEEIKAQISGELWVQQERWKRRSELYVEILRILIRIKGATIGMDDGAKARDREEVTRQAKAHNDALDQLADATAISQIILGPVATTALDNMAREWSTIRSVVEAARGIPPSEADTRRYLEAINRAHQLLVKAAKDDLGLN